MRDGWLHTGDLGYLSDGELFVCGRLKDLIVINGRKYHPQDLEWSVEGLPGVRRGRVVAFGARDANRVVIVAEPNGSVAAAALSAEIRRIIGDCFGLAVGDVVLVPGGTIDRTTSGKIRRAAVHESHERGELTGPVNPVGSRVSTIGGFMRFAATLVVLAVASPAAAQVTRLEISSREVSAASSGSRASRTVKSTRPTGGTASSRS